MWRIPCHKMAMIFTLSKGHGSFEDIWMDRDLGVAYFFQVWNFAKNWKLKMLCNTLSKGFLKLLEKIAKKIEETGWVYHILKVAKT
jgi:hypothetical protein